MLDLVLGLLVPLASHLDVTLLGVDGPLLLLRNALG